MSTEFLPIYRLLGAAEASANVLQSYSPLAANVLRDAAKDARQATDVLMSRQGHSALNYIDTIIDHADKVAGRLFGGLDLTGVSPTETAPVNGESQERDSSEQFPAAASTRDALRFGKPKPIANQGTAADRQTPVSLKSSAPAVSTQSDPLETPLPCYLCNSIPCECEPCEGCGRINGCTRDCPIAIDAAQTANEERGY